MQCTGKWSRGTAPHHPFPQSKASMKSVGCVVRGQVVSRHFADVESQSTFVTRWKGNLIWPIHTRKWSVGMHIVHALRLSFLKSAGCLAYLIHVHQTLFYVNMMVGNSPHTDINLKFKFSYSRVSSRNFGLGWKWAWQLHTPLYHTSFTINFTLDSIP